MLPAQVHCAEVAPKTSSHSVPLASSSTCKALTSKQLTLSLLPTSHRSQEPIADSVKDISDNHDPNGDDSSENR
jgi:hypothetical protein